MQKRTVIGCLLGVAWVGLGSEPAQAEIFQTGQTLKPGAFSLGVEPQVYLVGAPAWKLNLHGAAGLTPGMDLGVTWGLPLPGSGLTGTLGADVEFEVLRTDGVAPSLSVSVGAHAEGTSRFWLDGTLLLSKKIRRVEPYVGLDCDLSLPPATIQPWLRGILGLDIRLAKVTSLLLELGLGFPSVPSYLSFGLSFYL